MNNSFANKKLTFLTDHIKEIITEYNDSDSTAARIRKSFFLQRKYLGSKDRKCITGVFYFYFRHYTFASSHSIPELLILSYNFDPVVSNALNKLIRNIDLNDYISSFFEIDISILDQFDSLSATNFFPDLFLDNIKIDSDELEDLCNSLNKEATTDIRIIDNKSEIEEDLIQLRASYFTNIVPDCLKIKGNVNLDSTNTYRNGDFEIQDEGSQLISIALSPNEGESVLDYCSGGGGKSLHLAQLSNDSARIVATDISDKRLNETKRRILKLGLKSISVREIDEVKESKNKYDKILVDAPCTGSGTVRRAPDIRVRIDEKSIEFYHSLQLEILEEVVSKLKPGGILVYSTCSLFERENDETVANFLSLHNDIEPLSTIGTLQQHGLETHRFTETKFGIQTFTHKTQMDSFYISTLKKI